MPVNIGQLFARNWGIKLAAIFFAVMLYVAVAAQQPLSQRFALRLIVTVPRGARCDSSPWGNRHVERQGERDPEAALVPPHDPQDHSRYVLRVGMGIHLQPSDVSIPKGTDVQVAEIAPRDWTCCLTRSGGRT